VRACMRVCVCVCVCVCVHACACAACVCVRVRCVAARDALRASGKRRAAGLPLLAVRERYSQRARGASGRRGGRKVMAGFDEDESASGTRRPVEPHRRDACAHPHVASALHQRCRTQRAVPAELACLFVCLLWVARARASRVSARACACVRCSGLLRFGPSQPAKPAPPEDETTLAHVFARPLRCECERARLCGPTSGRRIA
jgi:hypothetical protein